MPTTRRSAATTRGRSAPTKGQSTISFHNKVTKSVPKDTKKAVLSAPAVADVSAELEKPAEIEDDVIDVKPDVQETEEQPEVEAAPQIVPEPLEKSEAEAKAEKISGAQIGKYWKAIEKERLAPRVHQQSLSLSEKVLRYFDVSSQYGPCVGITRMKRWNRAQRLGLNPPIEVLAILLQEEKKKTKGIQTAYIDEILNSEIAAGA